MTTDPGAAAPEPQLVIAPLTGAAIFLAAVLTPGQHWGVPGRLAAPASTSAAAPGDPAPGGDDGAPARPGPPGTRTIGSLKGAPGDG